MESKQTHGPWYVNEANEVFGPDLGPAGSTRIGTVDWRQNQGLEGPQESRLRAEANARLIAAAPCLLAALEEVLAELDEREPPQGSIFCDTGGMLLARAAIARAKGQP